MALMSVAARDRVWIGFLAVCLVPMLLVDLAPFWVPRSGPLSRLSIMRDFAIATYPDPLVASPAPPRWFRFLTLVEVGFQLPAVAWVLAGLWSAAAVKPGPRRAGVGIELLALVLAAEMALSAALCAYDIPGWDPVEYPDELKGVFLWRMYMPFVVLPTLMAADMYWRLLHRLDSGPAEKNKTQ